MARPSSYSEQTAAAICERLANGETILAICRDEGMPSHVTMYRWLEANEEFRTKYAFARNVGYERMADEVLEIADDSSGDFIEGEDGPKPNGELVARSRLRVDTRKWLLSKALPKRYGERVTNVHEGGDKPVEITDTAGVELARRVAFLLARAANEPAMIEGEATEVTE